MKCKHLQCKHLISMSIVKNLFLFKIFRTCSYGLKSLQQLCATYGVRCIMYSLIHCVFVLMTRGDLKWTVGQEAKERFCSGFPFMHEQGTKRTFSCGSSQTCTFFSLMNIHKSGFLLYSQSSVLGHFLSGCTIFSRG